MIECKRCGSKFNGLEELNYDWYHDYKFFRCSFCFTTLAFKNKSDKIFWTEHVSAYLLDEGVEGQDAKSDQNDN